MKRLNNLLKWAACLVCGIAIFIVIMTVAFWDTVVIGRSLNEQLEGGK